MNANIKSTMPPYVCVCQTGPAGHELTPGTATCTWCKRVTTFTLPAEPGKCIACRLPCTPGQTVHLNNRCQRIAERMRDA